MNVERHVSLWIAGRRARRGHDHRDRVGTFRSKTAGKAFRPWAKTNITPSVRLLGGRAMRPFGLCPCGLARVFLAGTLGRAGRASAISGLMTTLLVLSGCATPQAKASPPNQLQELPVTGLDTMNREQCFHAALEHHNESWRVVSATPPTTGRLYNSLHHASWNARSGTTGKLMRANCDM